MGEGFIGVVLGGLLAMASGALTPTIQHFLTKRTRDEETRRVNQIALISDIHALENWIDRLQKNYLFDSGLALEISPMANIEATVLVHFPEQAGALADLQSSLASHKLWMIDQAKLRISGSPINLDGYRATYEPLSLSQRNLIRAVADQIPLSA